MTNYPTLTINFSEIDMVTINPKFRDQMATMINPVIEIKSIRTREESQTIFFNLADNSVLFCECTRTKIQFSTTSKKHLDLFEKIRAVFMLALPVTTIKQT
jgi:hypothetical protein